MTSFCHLILTAFNLRIQHAPGLQTEWLDHRFELFEKFCFPSVVGQTNQAFTWLLLLDPDTPARYKERIERLARDYSRLRPVFTTLVDYREPTLQHVDSAATHLITTTLDNDDALGVGFVDRVQSEFRGQHSELIDLVEGYRLHLGSSRLYRHRVQTNPFISLIERNDRAPRTIRGCGPHNLISESSEPLRHVVSEPLWLQVVHDRNIAATGVWGCRRVDPTTLREKFTIDYRAQPQSRLRIGIENSRRTLERAAIDLLGERNATSLRRMAGRLRTLASARSPTGD